MPDDWQILTDRLAHRFTVEKRPLALVVGSAISQQGGRGVSNVKGMISAGLASHPYVDPDGSLLKASQSSAVDLGDIYREFMGQLIKFRGRGAADALVEEAVLAAWSGATEPIGDGLDRGDLGGWQLTDGLIGLADLAAIDPAMIRAIITPNFDPLIEVALRRRDIHTRRLVITGDAPIPAAPSASDGPSIDVIYVHGFWRNAATMHTEEQLTYLRPRLLAGIGRQIKNTDVLVVGYGGWDDVITTALESIAMDDGASAEVLWAFYESDTNAIRARNRTLLGRVGRLVSEGLFHQYAGIDCHALFSRVASSVDSRPIPTNRSGLTRTAPSGWAVVDDAMLSGAREIYTDQDFRSYFDGRAPDWAVASSPLIPRLNIVDDLCNNLMQASKGGESLWQFVVAAAGDGKSTALLQVGCRMVGEGWDVIWRPHAGAPLVPAEFGELALERPTVVLIDEADGLIGELRELARDAGQKRPIHIIAATRLADWRNSGGGVATFAPLQAVEVPMGALTRREGREIIASWASVPNGLGKLVDEPTEEARLASLLAAVESDRRSNGSLLGGLFRLRFDKARLDAHVAELLASLERHEIQDSHVSLLRAFLFVCALEVAGIDGIDRRLWADLLGVDVTALRRTVEFSLGTEAATARAGGIVQVRHPELATSAIRLHRTRDYAIDLGSLYAEIVDATISLGRTLKLRNYSDIVHLATKLPDKLVAIGYRRDQAFDISQRAAEASVVAEPDLLVYRTDLGSLLRKRGRAEDAVDLYIDAYSEMRHFKDRRWYSAGFFFDWSIAYLDSGDPRSSLVTLSMAWNSEPSEPTRPAAGKYLVQLSRAFLRIYRDSGSDRARLGLAAISLLADLAMISAEDYHACYDMAVQGQAPATASISPEKAFLLLERAIREAVRDCSALTVLPHQSANSFQGRLSKLLGDG